MYWRLFVHFVLPILVLVGIDWALAIWLNTDAPHSLTVIGAGLLSFILVYDRGQENTNSIFALESSIRTAIAVSIVVQYLVLIGIVAFFAPSTDNDKLSAITQPLISSFTTIVSVVIAFYFGSSTITEIQQRRATTGQRADNTKEVEII